MPITTLATQNKLLGYTTGADLTRDALITALIPMIQATVFNYCGYTRFLNRMVQYEASTFAFISGTPATITDSASGFVDAYFVTGDYKVLGSIHNDKVVNVKTVAAGTLTLETGETLTTEAAGESIIMTKIAYPANIDLLVSQYMQKFITPEGKSSNILSGESLPGGYSWTGKNESDIMKIFDGYRSL